MHWSRRETGTRYLWPQEQNRRGVIIELYTSTLASHGDCRSYDLQFKFSTCFLFKSLAGIRKYSLLFVPKIATFSTVSSTTRIPRLLAARGEYGMNETDNCSVNLAKSPAYEGLTDSVGEWVSDPGGWKPYLPEYSSASRNQSYCWRCCIPVIR